MLEHAALLDAGGVVGALELDRDLGLDRLVELHLLQVDVLEAAADRVQLLVLDDDRDAFRALELEVEERGAAGEHVADLALGDLEGAGLRAAGVDDARARSRRGAGAGRCASRTPCAERPSAFRVKRPSDRRG